MAEIYDAFYRTCTYCADGCDRAREVLPEIIAAHVAGMRILDLGCGRGHVVAALRRAGLTAYGLDPALPGSPTHCLRGEFFDLISLADDFATITAFDVLEHIHPDEIGAFLSAIRISCQRACFAIANMSDIHDVDGVPTQLPLIQEQPAWWMRLLADRGFRHLRLQPLPYPERFFIWAGPWPFFTE